MSEEAKNIDPYETDVNRLIGYPLNLLTEEQAQIVIEFKAQQLANEKEYQTKIGAYKEELEEVKRATQEMIATTDADMQELKERALAFYNAQ